MTESNLVTHARRELELVREDPEIVETTLAIVREFAKVGHSGVSAHFHIELISDLLRYKNLAPLTDDPAEWIRHEDNLWQNARNSEAFSHDRGKTYSLLGERRRRRWPRRGWKQVWHNSAPSVRGDVA